MSEEGSARCRDCASPLAEGQRYCLACGARAGSPDPLLAALKRRVAGTGQEEGDASRQALAPGPASSTQKASGLRLPPVKASVLLILLCLGFGVLLGGAGGAHVQDTLAASTGSRLKLLLPAPAAASASSSSTSSDAESPQSSMNEEAPAEVEPTPTPAPTTASTPSKPAATNAKGESNAGSSSPAGGGEGAGAAPGPAKKLPPIKHVFVVMLSDQPYAAAFGPDSPAHHLAGTLEHKGTLLVHYDAVAHEELANEIALISGQGPTAETAANCPTYGDLAATGIGPEEQVLGNGCIYPSSTQTLPGQLAARHLTWRAYLGGVEEGAAGPAACSHPVPGQADASANQLAGSGPYATFRNPFVYFHSIIDTPACAADDVGLGRLKTDLSSPSRTPNFSYIAPDRCEDGNPTPCTAGAAAGLAQSDGFIERVVGEILASKAYKQGGLIAITVDEAPSSGEFADSSACCGQPSFPNLPPGASGLSPRGGGAVGALLLSPYLKGGVTNQEPYNHFSLLRTIEDLFGLGHLGYAALPAVKPFEDAMFSASKLG